jgi:hypothetical protein
MAKYHRGLSMTERSRNSQRTGTTNVMAGGESFLSKTNQILMVFSVEFIVETAKMERLHVQRRAIANTVEEVLLLVKQECHRRNQRFIECIGEPLVLGKDRTWMTLGARANKLGARLTDEVMYVENGVR